MGDCVTTRCARSQVRGTNKLENARAAEQRLQREIDVTIAAIRKSVSEPWGTLAAFKADTGAEMPRYATALLLRPPISRHFPPPVPQNTVDPPKHFGGSHAPLPARRPEVVRQLPSVREASSHGAYSRPSLQVPPADRAGQRRVWAHHWSARHRETMVLLLGLGKRWRDV